MSAHNLNALFQPRSIAVIGASNRPDSVGYTIVKNLLEGGFAGPVYPVNPKYDTIQGLAAVSDVAKLPATPDLALLAVPAAIVPAVVDALATRGTGAAVVISAGFRESGSAGIGLEEQLATVRRKHDGLRILGPNCLGFVVPGMRLNASFAGQFLKPGRIAFVSQSGAVQRSAGLGAQREYRLLFFCVRGKHARR